MTTEDRKTQIKVGIFILIGLTITGMLLIYYGRLGEGFANYYNLRVEFANASGIIRGSEVLLAGAKVGRVTADPVIMPDMQGVNVELRILEQVRIPVESQFSIGSSGLLGDKYIQIVLKSGKPEGPLIEPDSTIKGSDIGDGIGGLTEGAGDLIADLRTTVKNINMVVEKLDRTVLSESELESISTTVKNLQTTTGQLAESSGRFASLLKTGQETMESAKKASDEFRSLAQQAHTGRGVLGMLISNREMADNLRAFILNLRKHGILWYKDTQKSAQGDEP
jgi:phospholipid/cholesterol/gamma-HCH transport system substrate-binding protein